jgi:(p)ppGpp synthase/HD superfamily hydrolase
MKDGEPSKNIVEQYKQIVSLLAEFRAGRTRNLKPTLAELSRVLGEAGAYAEVSARSKRIHSIWCKMQRRGLAFEQILDVYGARIIVPEEDSCYQVLDIIHDRWQPIISEFDDYIATPKDNSYQSLHTTVITDDGDPLEVQIRTPEMHENAEYGAAAHWRYKEASRKHIDEASEGRLLAYGASQRSATRLRMPMTSRELWFRPFATDWEYVVRLPAKLQSCENASPALWTL